MITSIVLAVLTALGTFPPDTVSDIPQPEPIVEEFGIGDSWEDDSSVESEEPDISEKSGEASKDGEPEKSGEASKDEEASKDGEPEKSGEASKDGEPEKSGEASKDGEADISEESVNPVYTSDDLRYAGVIYADGVTYTWYSESELPGGGLDIPGRHHENGFIMDGDGNICIASCDHPRGTYLETSFGPAIVYDYCPTSGVRDVYLP